MTSDKRDIEPVNGKIYLTKHHIDGHPFAGDQIFADDIKTALWILHWTNKSHMKIIGELVCEVSNN